MALMFKGLLLGVILVNVWRYYSYFHRIDHKLALFGIALGTCSSMYASLACRRLWLIASAQLGLNSHQVRQLIIHASVDYAGIARNDAWETLAVTFMTAHFNAAATAFYSWRAWKVRPGIDHI